jgi:general secretion pathway protein L
MPQPDNKIHERPPNVSTLYIRTPSKAAAENSGSWTGLPCVWALVAPNGRVESSGQEALSSLATEVARAQKVVLILAASDVSLLQVQVPPMPASKLRLALPNLVEEQLISDPADSVLAATGSGVTRTVAVVQKAWLDLLSRAVLAAGARSVAALPAQLCLPRPDEGASAALSLLGDEYDLAVRLDEHQGLGLPILPDKPADLAGDTLESLQALVPAGPLRLAVPTANLQQFANSLQNHADAARIELVEDDWQSWVAGAQNAQTLDLMSGLASNARPAFNWRAWRWPLGLAAALVLINIIGLQIDWWRMKSEANALRNTMAQIYRSAFPQEPVVDPVAQMRQKLASARRGSGEAAADDFLALAANFAQALGESGKPASDAIAGVDYKEKSLLVRFKPGTEPSMAAVNKALALRSLSATDAPAQGGVRVWQIRSAK